MENKNSRQLNNYSGAVHIHSKFSDGTGDIGTITKAAKKAGLDWIIITDHNSLEVEEGFINGVCVIRGEEISPNEGNNHYLAFGTDKLINPDMKPEDYIEEVHAQSGFGFAAHPDELQTRKNSAKPIRWLDKNIIPDGVEIWNWFSVWADNYDSKNIFTSAYAYLFKDKLITKPYPETLGWWDEINNKSEKIVPAAGGVDAHALKIKDYIIPVTIFPYEDMFRTITNVINLNEKLSDDFNCAKKQILNAVKTGRNLIVNRKLCKKLPEIFVNNTGTIAYCGESIVCDNNTYITIKLGKKFTVRLLCDGKIVFEKQTAGVKIPLKNKGKYRAEVSLNNLGYAYSNPIMVV